MKTYTIQVHVLHPAEIAIQNQNVHSAVRIAVGATMIANAPRVALYAVILDEDYLAMLQ